jgi:membrane-bound lytic murein transglycosylase D
MKSEKNTIGYFLILFVMGISAGYFLSSFKADDDEKGKLPYVSSHDEKLLSVLSPSYLTAYTRDTAILNSFKFDLLEIPQYSDSIFSARFKSIQKTIPLNYDKEIRGFINLYLVKKRPLVTRLIGRSYDYYPMFEEKLKAKGMPDELKHLAIIESALNPLAKSPAGALGLWQFIPSTARLYNLRVDGEVDERIDPERSTDAALSYLKDLHRIYGDWLLAIAAYNCGPGNVNKALKKAAAAGKGRDFKSIRAYLPRETVGYVPAFVAACYFMNYYSHHNLKAIDPRLHIADWIEVEITENFTFPDLARHLRITTEEISCFNPSFEKDQKVNVKDSTICFSIPAHLHHLFYANEQSIYNPSRFILSPKED